jgi:CHAT domain-containing protein
LIKRFYKWTARREKLFQAARNRRHGRRESIMKWLSRPSCPVLACCLACGLALTLVRAQDQTETARDDAEQFVKSEALTSVEQRKRALAERTADAERLRRAGDVVALVRALNRLGQVHLKLNDAAAAFAAAQEALPLARQSRNETLLVDALNFHARVSRLRQDNKAALRLLNEAHALSLRIKYRKGEAESLTELGATYFQQSDLAKTEAFNDEALRLWRELQDKQGEARTLFNSGAPYMRQGKSQQAAEALKTAAAIWHESGMLTEEASALIDLNFLAIRQGQWQKALTLLKEVQSLAIDKEAEPYIHGQIATSLGEIYEAYGQLQTSLNYFEEALILYRDHARDESAAVDASRKAGRVQARIGDYSKAVSQIEEGLQLAQKIDDRFMVALCHEDLGRVHLSVGLYVPAKQEFLEAIALYQQTGNRREWARAQSYLGQTAYVQGDRALAADSYHKALQVFQNISDYTNEAALCFGLGKLELEQQRLEEAGNYLKRSIALTEQLRENAASKDLRSSFLASVHDRYETYVEWLMQLHVRQPDKQFNVAAFEASELGRARSLLDTLKDYQRELRQVAEPSLLAEEAALQNKEQELFDRRAKLQSEGGRVEEREKIENELTQLRARRETLEAQINSTARFNDLLRPSPLTFEDIKKQITDTETSLLEYSLGAQKSYLWVVTPDNLVSYELPDKSTIEKAARKLADLLARPQTEPARQAELQSAIAEVSRLVLGPVAGKLKSSRLIIVPDGILQYISFQILTASPDTDEPLVTRFEIVNAPSASTLAVVQQDKRNRPSASKLLAAFGDPVLQSNYALKAPASNRAQTGELIARNDGTRERGAGDERDGAFEPSRLPPLFFAKQELNELRKLVKNDESIIYEEFDASRDNLRNLDLSQYRILHIATHGLLDSKQPELSGLVLSMLDREGKPMTGFVGLSDIYNLRAPVDLVVLSACNTALGKEVRGEGLIGLTRGFMYAGASSVVASLWKADDEATSELMKRFYTNMLEHSMPPAAALRAAQNSIRQEPQWQSPHYWAAFTLQGEYRQIIRPTSAGAMPVYGKIIVIGALLALLAGAAWWYRRGRGMRIARRADSYSTLKR